MQEWTVFQWIGVVILGAIPVAAGGALIWWFADEDAFKRRVGPLGRYFHVFEIILYSGLIVNSLARAIGGSHMAFGTLLVWIMALVTAIARKWQQRRRAVA